MRRLIFLLSATSLVLLSGAHPAVAEAPSNDNFADAKPLAGPSGTEYGDNFYATLESDEQEHGLDSSGASVWYRWVAPADGKYNFETMTSDLDTVLAVYRGDGLASAVRIAFNDDVDTRGSSYLRFTATEGTEYRIVVAGEGNPPDTSYFSLEWRPVPSNDDFADAQTISGESGSVEGSLAGAGVEASEGFGEASVWYRWTAPETGHITFYTGPTGREVLYQFCTGLTSCSGGHSFGSIESTGYRYDTKIVSAGEVVYVRVWDRLWGEGTFTLNWVSAPANDKIENATPISGSSGTVAGTNLGAWTERITAGCPDTGFLDEPDHAGAFPAASVWYEWVAPANGRFVFDTLGSDVDTRLAIYRRPDPTCPRSIETTGPSNNDISSAIRASRVALEATAGNEYLIAIDGSSGPDYTAGGDMGDLKLTWGPPPSNDAFASATPIDGSVGQLNTTNAGATAESGEPTHAGRPGGSSVWFRWIAPSNVEIQFDTDGSDFDTVLAVYVDAEGGGVTTLGYVRANDDHGVSTSRLGFDALSGTTYYIAVDGKALPSNSSGISAENGSITLDWTTSPQNDDFAQRRLLVGESGTTPGSNEGATRENSEPDHNQDGDASVWYEWVAPATGGMRFEVAAEFEPTVAFYDDGTFPFLSFSGSVFEDPLAEPGTVAYRLRVVEGTSYYIAVDSLTEYGSFGTGPLILSWQLDSTPPVPSVAPLARFQKQTAFTVDWSAIDDPDRVRFDVRRGISGVGAQLAAPSLLLDGTYGKRHSETGATGKTYCYSVRATDVAGNASGFSPQRCTAIPLDNPQLTHSAGWAKKAAAGHFLSTFSQTRRKGAVLQSPRVAAKVIAVVVEKCRGCGTIDVLFGGKRIKRISLAATSSKKMQYINVVTFRSLRTGVVKIRVVSNNKRVVFDGLGIAKK